VGAWGVNTFDNDVACDWAYGLENARDLALVRGALQAILQSGTGPLDADLACEGLAACEVIARLKGQWGVRDAYTEEIDAWVVAHPTAPPPDLVPAATTAIDRVLSQPSELVGLWDETAEGEQWRAAVADLRARVTA
jgi:hypothetical protein